MSRPKEIIKMPKADYEIKVRMKKRQQTYCNKYYNEWSDTCFECPLHSLSKVTNHDCVKAYALYILR